MSVLQSLLEAAHRRVRRDARVTPLAELRRRVVAMPPAPRFEAALRHAERLALVAEIKRTSPSSDGFGAVARGPAAAADLARRDAAAGAAAVSVLTEPTRFGGDDRDLIASARVGCPVLRKDFTVHPYQVWQARALGAGAVLLIVRALDDDRLRLLLDAAGEAGVDALVEVHDAPELDRALAADATLVGVNARDLDTLVVDREAALALVAAARTSGATIVAESGLAEPSHLVEAAAAGAHAVLVGTSLLAAADPAGRARDLVRSAPRRTAMAVPPVPQRTLVKVCGLRDPGSVRAAASADADLAGFIVADGSRRRVDPAEAARLAGGLGGPIPVLVFRAPGRLDVTAATEAFVAVANRAPGIQLAGFDGPPDWLASAAAGHPAVIGVVHRPASVRAALAVAERWFAAGATHLLLEGASLADGGGTAGGAPIDVARRLNRIVPTGLGGGLTPSSVAAAVRQSRPAIVDAASGLERGGTTSPARVAAFVRAARRDPTGADRVDRHGRFGRFGGRYVPETLIAPLDDLAAAWRTARVDAAFRDDLARLQRDFIGRPTPLFELPAGLLGEDADGVRIFLKREDLAHTGAHKINNAVGQALLAVRMGKSRVVAETGAGQHGVATAAACALVGLECVVYMGTTDVDRQAPNVRRMRMLGAEVRPVSTGHGTLRDALNEALRDWVASVETTAYVLGTAAGPHPYPDLVAELQSVIGREARAQLLESAGRLPDVAIASVGGGSNAIGLFRPFLDARTRLIGVEAGGRGDGLGDNAASLGLGSPGVLHGALTMLTQTEDGQVIEPHSVSAGLDYPGVGPQLVSKRNDERLVASGRLEGARASDAEAMSALHRLTRCAGILPALESSHALALAARLAPSLERGSLVVVNLSGRGDKDLDIVESFGGVPCRGRPGRHGSVTRSAPPHAPAARRWWRTSWLATRIPRPAWPRRRRPWRPGPTCWRSASRSAIRWPTAR
jgi:tryptophan synthase beta chain